MSSGGGGAWVDDGPLYSVAHRLVYDAERDDVMVRTMVPADSVTVDIMTKNVARSTFAHALRAYPQRTPRDEPQRRAVLVNHLPAFETVSESEANEITARLSQPTFATRARSKDSDPAELKCPGPRTGKYDKKPEKSILKQRKDSKATSTTSKSSAKGTPRSTTSSKVTSRSHRSDTHSRHVVFD